MSYDPKCPECQGTGERDSGGTHPWGWPITVPCDCDQPPAHSVVTIPKDDFDALAEAIKNPPAPTEALKDLFRRHR